MMTRKEAAKFLGYSESYVKKLNIPTYKIGRKALYKKEDLTAFLTAKAERERSLIKR
ncbi:helix-turn-helix domain-containing protein [Prevotella pallens]|nr:helix-turn-helix domain-containing protein [Prevotella pallens]MBF1475663.1 helix-turn-helix domain-containing protein [Prevotella pallens]